MFGNRFSASRRCSTWRHETKPGRLDQARACRFLKVATHPYRALQKVSGRSSWYQNNPATSNSTDGADGIISHEKRFFETTRSPDHAKD